MPNLEHVLVVRAPADPPKPVPAGTLDLAALLADAEDGCVTVGIGATPGAAVTARRFCSPQNDPV